jgi:ABC-type glycerol-3-phosphate transport system permease component
MANTMHRSFAFALIVATLLIPPTSLIIPNFLVVDTLGWIDTLAVVICHDPGPHWPPWPFCHS